MRKLMELTPCDIFPYLRGRTIWLVGDSMMQVRATVSALFVPWQALHQTSFHACMAGPSGCAIPCQCRASRMHLYRSSITVLSDAGCSLGRCYAA